MNSTTMGGSIRNASDFSRSLRQSGVMSRYGNRQSNGGSTTAGATTAGEGEREGKQRGSSWDMSSVETETGSTNLTIDTGGPKERGENRSREREGLGDGMGRTARGSTGGIGGGMGSSSTTFRASELGNSQGDREGSRRERARQYARESSPSALSLEEKLRRTSDFLRDLEDMDPSLIKSPLIGRESTGSTGGDRLSLSLLKEVDREALGSTSTAAPSGETSDSPSYKYSKKNLEKTRK